MTIILSFILAIQKKQTKNHWSWNNLVSNAHVFFAPFGMMAKFRTLPNILYEVLSENSWLHLTVNYFRRTLHLRCLTGFWNKCYEGLIQYLTAFFKDLLTHPALSAQNNRRRCEICSKLTIKTMTSFWCLYC